MVKKEDRFRRIYGVVQDVKQLLELQNLGVSTKTGLDQTIVYNVDG